MCGGTRILLHGLVGPAILLALVCTFALPAVAQRPPATDKPNIVLFIADDLSIADMGCYGNAAVRTPNVDRLAREGLRFTHAFAGSPTCTPSRSVMYTGLFPLRNGAHPNHSAIHPGTKTLGHHLQARGYRVVLAGKKHIKPLDAFGFEYLDAAFNPGLFGTLYSGKTRRKLVRPPYPERLQRVPIGGTNRLDSLT